MRDTPSGAAATESNGPDDPSSPGLLRSPLHAAHVALGATMGPFGGWEMPISYAGGGVVAEHTAVRETVGVFDVSHLGKASVTGPGAAAFVNRCLSADLRRIEPGQAQYTLCCNESGGVIDDLIVYLVGDDEVLLVPNAANTATVVATLQTAAGTAGGSGVSIVDRHREFGVLAVQGPASAAVLTELGLPTELDYMSWRDAEFGGAPVRVCRTGYTGEHGYELLPSWSGTRDLWDALLTAVAARGGLPAGLGARDTLRTEMGYPLHGQDLSPEISPLQARASWAVGWKKDQFFGRQALLAEKAAGPRRLLWGLDAIDRGVLRPHQNVTVAGDAAGEAGTGGRVVGQTTSGTFSPTLGHAIALALIDASAGVDAGDELAVDVRGRLMKVRVVRPPFVPSHVR